MKKLSTERINQIRSLYIQGTPKNVISAITGASSHTVQRYTCGDPSVGLKRIPESVRQDWDDTRKTILKYARSKSV